MAVKLGPVSVLLALFSVTIAPLPAVAAPARPSITKPLELKPCRIPNVVEELRCGIHHIPENRESRTGKMLPIKVILLPARAPRLAQEPIFWMMGGPGESAPEIAAYLADNWRRKTHDIVLIDQRGAGDGHLLRCPSPGSDADLQSYLLSFEPPALVRTCRHTLEKEFDLSQYTTPIAADDYDEVRRALGYDRIHLHGGSYGSRLALAYLRKYDRHVRTALLFSLVPFENPLPLYHAAGRQDALDALIADCMRDERCRSAYPDPKGDLARVIERLRVQPARVTIPHPVTGAPADVMLDEEAFVEAVSGMMYWSPANHSIPLLLRLAASGDFVRLAKHSVARGRGIYSSLTTGMMLSVTCGEDVARIQPEDVVAKTAGSFAGAFRVKAQIAACAEWPKGTMPPGYFKPFQTKVPTLLISGKYDPPAGPRWGELSRKYFANNVHIILPYAHAPEHDCVGEVAGSLLSTGSLRNLDTSCIAKLQPPPFRMLGE